MKSKLLVACTLMPFALSAQTISQFRHLFSPKCDVEINCGQQECEVTISKGHQQVTVSGTIKSDNAKKLHTYNKYTDYEERWFHRDAMTVIDQVLIKKNWRGSYDATIRVEHHNLWPHWPKIDVMKTSCSNLQID